VQQVGAGFSAVNAAGSEHIGAVGASASVEFVRHQRARRYLIRVRLDGSVRVTIPRRGSKREATAFYLEQQRWVASQQQRVQQVRRDLPADLPLDVQKRLRREAKVVLPQRLRELAQKAGVTIGTITIRNQRRRWGSCSASGAISLNWRLITMPEWVRDYVMYHELMHVERMDHSPAFWALVKRVCPDYEDARRWLRQHAHAPHAASPSASC
jgi:predicted metal-dependent hydrolase